MSTYLKDLLERVLWTAAQAGIGVVVVESADWDGVWVPVIAVGLAAIKGYIARYVGDPDSAATLLLPPAPEPGEAE
jgi:hypothetical protein